MTLVRKLGLGALFIVVALIACASWILTTESGARFLLGRAQPYLPPELALGEIRGSLIRGIHLASVDWNSATVEVAIRSLSVEIELARLFSRHLAVRSLDVAKLTIVARTIADTDSDGGLPSVDSPLHVSIDSSSLRDFSFTRENFSRQLDDVQVRGSMKGSRLDVTQLVVRSSWLNADLAGRITIAGDYPGRVNLNWSSSASPSVDLAGRLEARGDLRRYDVEHTLNAPQNLSTSGHVSYVDNTFEFDLSNEWATLQWQLGNTLLTSSGGSLRLAGGLGSTAASLDTLASLGGLPEMQIEFEGVLDPEKIRMSRLDVISDLGRLAASGDVRWQPELAFDVAYSVDDLDPSLASGLLAGQLNARGTATGEWVAGAPKVTVVIGALGGRVNDQPLGGGGTLRYSEGQASVSGGRIQLGDNRLAFSGAVGDRLALDAQAELLAIRELLPDASGSLSANITLSGSRETPEGRLDMSGNDLSWSDYAIASLNVDAAVSRSQDLAMRINLEKVLNGNNEIDSVDLAAQGTLDQHILRAEIQGQGNRVTTEAAGTYVDGGWSGSVRSLLIDNALAGAWSLREPADLAVTRDSVSVSRACFDRAVETGQACLQAAVAPERPATFDIAISDLPLSALPIASPEVVALSGFVDVRGEGSVIANRLTGNGSISLRDARVDAIVDDETISAAFTRAAADLSVLDNRAVTTLRLELADGLGSTALDLTVDDFMDIGSAVAGRGTVEINDLSLLAVLLPDITGPRGSINGGLDIAGSLGDPEFVGVVAISDGAFGFRKTGIEVLDINIRVAQLSAGRLQLEGSARSGDGQITIKGETWASADTGVRSELLITGQNFELSRLPDWQVSASPSIAVVLDDRVTKVTGNLFIPTTNVRVKDIPDTAASASPDAVVHRGEGAVAAARRRIDVDIAVGLGENVRFAGFGLSTGIGGAVRIRGGSHAQYTGSGRLSLRDGQYRAYGQELEIERGQLIFSGPLDNPLLDVRAVRRMSDVTAGIQLSGTSTRLQSSLFSEPPLGDAETLSYLLTGRPLSSATSAGEGDTLNAAAFALGVSSAGNIVSQVRTGLGLETLAVEGGADDGRLIAGKRFGSRLFVEYGYGLIDKLGTLLLRYQLSDRIILESRTGTVSNFDILYSVKKR